MPMYDINVVTKHFTYPHGWDTDKSAAKRLASNIRRTGGDFAQRLTIEEDPHVTVVNTVTKEVIYIKPFCKKAIQKR
jgi:hypothetical protein